MRKTFIEWLKYYQTRDYVYQSFESIYDRKNGHLHLKFIGK